MEILLFPCVELKFNLEGAFIRENIMIIKQATVTPIIGVEVNAMDGLPVHVLDLHIQAKGIDPKDFKYHTGKYDVVFKKVPVPQKKKVDYFAWVVFFLMFVGVGFITEGYIFALGMVGVMLLFLGVAHLMVWCHNKYKVEL